MFIPARVYDNPSLMDNDPMYVKRLEALPEQDRKALLDGDWNIFAGQYFKDWRVYKHVVEPFYIPKIWKRFIGGDYGHHKPSSIGWYAVSPEGIVYRYREIYKEGLHYNTLGELLCEESRNEDIEYGVFDPAIFGDKQHHTKTKDSREGKSGAEIIQESINEWFKKENRQNDSFIIVRGDNRRIGGWGTVKQALKDETFKIFSNCTNFISTFPANVHDPHKPEDLNTNGEDHTADETRYALTSMPPETDLKSEKHLSHVSPLYKMNQIKKEREEYER